MLRVVSGFLGRLGVLGDIIAILGYGVLVIGYLMNLWKLFGAVGPCLRYQRCPWHPCAACYWYVPFVPWWPLRLVLNEISTRTTSKSLDFYSRIVYQRRTHNRALSSACKLCCQGVC